MTMKTNYITLSLSLAEITREYQHKGVRHLRKQRAQRKRNRRRDHHRLARYRGEMEYDL